ncbi:MAG: S9 family peptidase, partial [Candidatus Marinimicrobia bacterium]|nr:S9 family peptidase [Candidatus Neomarinimicrobiota bacterium]
MKKNAMLFILAIFSLLLIISCQTKESIIKESTESGTSGTIETLPTPPLAEKKAYQHSEHDVIRQDPWYWLRERENPDVISYLNAENVYTDTMMADTEELQTQLYDEMVGRIKQDDASVPYFLNGYYYYNRYEEDQEYPIYARKKGNLNAEEEILLNVNDMAKGFAYYRVSGLRVSENNQFLAFAVDTVSRRKYTLYIKDLSSGSLLEDHIDNTTGRSAWAADNKTLFFDRKDETLRPFEIYRYTLGIIDSETLVYHEPEDTYASFVYKSKSRKYIIIGSESTLSSEYRRIPADAPLSEPRVIHQREADILYQIDHYKESFYIFTNDNAINFRLMKCPVNDTAKEKWSEVIAHRPDVLLEGFEIFSDYYVL